MSNATSSQGVFIERGVGSPLVFSTIAEVTSINGPTDAAEEIDVTHLLSPNGYREFLQSFKDAGEVPLEMNFLPGDASQDELTGLRQAYVAGTVDTYRINYPSASKTCTFLAFVKTFPVSAQVGEKLSATATLRITGEPTWA